MVSDYILKELFLIGNDIVEEVCERIRIVGRNAFISARSLIDNRAVAIWYGICLVAESLMPYNVNECLFVQLPGNLTACKFVCISFGCRQSNGACGAVEYLANIVAVGERRASALDSAEELTPYGRLYMADRQTVLDSYGTTIAVTHKATKGTAAWSSVIVDYVTVEQTVGNVGYGL